jgi:hypothetical protein
MNITIFYYLIAHHRLKRTREVAKIYDDISLCAYTHNKNATISKQIHTYHAITSSFYYPHTKKKNFKISYILYYTTSFCYPPTTRRRKRRFQIPLHIILHDDYFFYHSHTTKIEYIRYSLSDGSSLDHSPGGSCYLFWRPLGCVPTFLSSTCDCPTLIRYYSIKDKRENGST